MKFQKMSLSILNISVRYSDVWKVNISVKQNESVKKQTRPVEQLLVTGMGHVMKTNPVIVATVTLR